MTVRRFLAAAVLLAVAAATVYGVLRATYGPRPAYVHVRWSPSVDAATRAGLERQYSLIRGEPREGSTWAYDLADLSTSNIRSLVENPRVEDTHNIHRTNFRAGFRTARGRYVGAENSWLPVLLEIAIVGLLLAGLGAAGLAAIVKAGLSLEIGRVASLHGLGDTARQSAAVLSLVGSRIVGWLADRIPPATPEAVAVFRVLFGALVVWIPLEQAVSSAWMTTGPTNETSGVQDWALSVLTTAPGLVDWFSTWIVAWGALFVLGVLSRVSFVMLCVGVFAWATVYTTQIGSHQISALLLALPCLCWARWGDAWSVDAWLRRARGLAPKQGSPREYGYTVWLPGLVLGVAFAAAAFAKIREGPDWILNGTVKYHFLSDSGDAIVDWGLRIAPYAGLAVFLSFSAVAVESLVIVGAFARRYAYRALAGLGAMSILIGFLLFQGLFWPAWWALLISFLPWHLVRPDPRPALETGPVRLTPLRKAHVALVVILVAQQIVASALKLEIGPMLSAYDMYSTTYDSPSEYEAKGGMSYWLIARFDDGTSSECGVSRADAELVAAELGSAKGHGGFSARVLERCINEHRDRLESKGSLRTVAVEGRWTAVDWDAWRLAGEKRVSIAAPVDVSPPATP